MLFRAKFAHGLLSGDYSKSAENTENSVGYCNVLVTLMCTDILLLKVLRRMTIFLPV